MSITNFAFCLASETRMVGGSHKKRAHAKRLATSVVGAIYDGKEDHAARGLFTVIQSANLTASKDVQLPRIFAAQPSGGLSA